MPTPSGIFELPLYYLMKTLAASAAFRGLVGAVDADDAERFVFEDETDERTALDEMPRCRIAVDPGGFESRKVSTTGWTRTGKLSFCLEVPTPAEYVGDARQGKIWFRNQVGAMVKEMEALAGGAGYLNITHFKEFNTGRADPDENNGESFHATIWEVQYLD